jgi:hypothetical protein
LESNSSQPSSGKQNNGMERWGPDKMRNLDANNSKMEVTIGEDLQDNRPVIKERPIWLTESTVVENTSVRVRKNSLNYVLSMALELFFLNYFIGFS